MNTEFRVVFTFYSLISISSIIGFCAGVIGVPIFILQTLGGTEPLNIWLTVLMVFVIPFAGAINGAFMGLLAYPVYYWLTRKISFKYTGEIHS